MYHIAIDGQGAYQCSSGMYGSVSAVTTHGDTIVVPFTNPFPNSCGDDDVAGELQAVIATDSGITSLVIEAMQPASWTLPLPPPDDLPAHSSMDYRVMFDRWMRCPPTNDSLAGGYLNNPVLRAGMTEAWGNSHPDTTLTSARVERGGFLYRDPVADTFFYRLTPSIEDTPCTSVNTPPNDSTISWIVAEFHTHPFRGRDRLPKPMCDTTTTVGSHTDYDVIKWGGPSKDDWRRSVFSDQRPMYIMDMQNIYKTDTSKTDSLTWRRSARRWPRKTSSCFLF